MAEYRQYIEKDGALERRFQPIMVDEPSVAEAIEILTAAAPRYDPSDFQKRIVYHSHPRQHSDQTSKV